MSLNRIADRFDALGCKATLTEGGINLEVDDTEIFIEFDEGWSKAVKTFYKARQYTFDTENRVLYSNRAAEYLVVRLDPGFYHRVEHEFEDGKENKVSISPASKEFLLSYFESTRYEDALPRVKERIHRRVRIRTRSYRRHSRRIRFRPDDIFFSFHTVTYKAKRKPRNKKIGDVALERIKSCLFALAYTKDESWELSKEIKGKGLIYSPTHEEEDDTLAIPAANYDSATVTYYKVAKSSQFPSQVFLSYYHILEFHFLRVADEALYNSVCSQLNDPSFKASYENINRLLATIKRNDTTVDEREMLRDVLRKYVAEDDFIQYVSEIEQSLDEKVYSSSKQRIFGETFAIKLEKGHALSNVSLVLKHIRNALVHSSDHYTREDAFLPMSESETVVIKYIPLIQYLAEQVIFATAKT